MLSWAREAFTSEQISGVLAATSICFDLSVFELFVPLSWGGKVILAEDAVSLPQVDAANEVTLVNTVPSAMTELIRMGAVPLSVGTVNLAGEPLPKRLVDQLYEHPGIRQVFNLYGPSEDTTYSTYTLVPRAVDEAPNIGRPIHNTQVYLLNKELQPVPLRGIGELCIGGSGLARGYLDHPDLTAERFLPNPFSHVPGERIYRTGDLARFLPEGEIEFLGRIDNQVKLRGFRIELGEIEAALEQHPQVRQAAVVALERDLGERELVAYLVSQDGELNSGELRSWLKEQLPNYMVPTMFVCLPAFPLTPSGKVDRSGLPSPDWSMRKAETAYEAPRSHIEELLANVWMQLLRVKVGVHDKFFELGGHSLLATRAVSRINELFRLNLPVRVLFEAPTVASLAERIIEAQKDEQTQPVEPILPVRRDELIPLSFAQQRLWFLDRLEPGNPFYNMTALVRLAGPLNLTALEVCLNRIVERHECLRTSFREIDGGPVQIVAPFLSLSIPLLDLEPVAPDQRDTKLRQLANEEARRPFDLTKDPLIRIRALRLSQTEHVLLLSMHHIVSDGWSIAILVRELKAFYEGLSQNIPVTLDELPVQYADFAYWQRRRMEKGELDGQIAYWKEQLRGAPGLIGLTTDHVRPAEQTFRGGRVRFKLTRELTRGLQRVSREQSATLFMTMLTGFAALLGRYTGEREVMIGTPVAARNRVESEGLIGFFVNTLVVRAELGGDPTGSEMVGRVRQVCLEAYAHQEVPFERLVEELQVERTLSHAPLFQVMFGMNNVEREEVELGAARGELEEVESGTTKFDLTMQVEEVEGEVRGGLSYSLDLFEAESMERLTEHYVRLLEGLVANPEKRISELALLSAREWEELESWNETAVTESGRSVAEEFEKQVERTPDEVAVVYEGATLSYRELNERANQLAHYLRRQGVGAETLVGVCLERSVELVVGMLGVLKAGGAYVPIDPQYPAERVKYLLADGGVKVVVTAEKVWERFVGCEGRVVYLDRDWEEVESESRENPAVGSEGENLAYVIYTSGSTGTPKGVMVTQRAILNHLQWRQRVYPLGRADRFLQKAAISFDISVWELLGPLLAGARVVLAAVGGQRDSEYLVRTMAAAEISVVHFGPSMLQVVLQEPGLAECRSLRQVFCGGEALSVELAEQFEQRLGASLHHQYGPTETTVDVCVWDCERGGGQGRERVPIGRPIANTEVYILDEQQRVVPVGVRGELYVGGVSVARGYLQQPGLTAARFVPHPYSRVGGERLYRTGDLGRYLAGGEIEFLGRADEQVKLRGYRIEPGEIETVLQQHEQVEQAVVVLEEEEGEKQLVAYLVWAGGGAEPMLRGGLREYLRQRLPEYMVPARFVQLTKLPLTPNGKVDYRRLSSAEFQISSPADLDAMPLTPTEQWVAAIWRSVLKVDQIQADDNFFELGGHSLLATKVVARLRQAPGVELSLRRVFEEPTLSQIARQVEAELSTGERRSNDPIERVNREDGAAVDLSYAQQRLWFLEQLAQNNPFYNLGSALRIRGELDATALEQSLNEITRRHEVLRTTFADREGRPVGLVTPPEYRSLRVHDLSNTSGAEQETEAQRLIDQDSRQPFDLATGPLLRLTLLKFHSNEYLLLVNMHHIISDGWSINIFMRELAILYDAFSKEKASPLPELPIQYVDYARWQLSKTETFNQQLSYWREQLRGAPGELGLTTDHVRPAEQTFRGGRVRFKLTRELTRGLQRVSREQSATLFMTMLTGFAALLGRYTGEREVMIGTPVAARNRVESEGLIGFFVNTLVVRAELGGDPTGSEMVGRVRQVCLEAYAHQEVPFERLVEELQVERTLSHAPLFQVMFGMNNVEREEVELGAARGELEEVESGTTKFDLTMQVEEVEGEVRGGLSYSLDLFEAESMERLTEHYVRLLEGLVANPEKRISELALLSAREWEELESWNETAVTESGGSVAEEFEKQVERTPDEVAVVYEEIAVSYRELNERANQLGHYLRRQEVGAETLVGVCLERSVELVVGMLGVLKAGGAYVPIDPQYPAERVKYLLADGGLKVVVTSAAVWAGLGSSGERVVRVDEEREAIGNESRENAAVGSEGENLAYVIYTSGSTGTPKGVQLEQRGLLNLISWHQNNLSLNGRDRVAQVAGVTFDASLLEIWPTLLTGASLYFPPGETRVVPEQLREWLVAQSITISYVPTPVAEQLLQHEWPRETALRALLTGGDRLHVHPPSRIPFVLVNNYGPTETTVVSTAGFIGSEKSAKLPSIGRPISNTKIYVLDAQLQVVPRGVQGELYIGGVGLARGYVRGSDLTAERFIPNPFSEKPGERLYRTGDLVRLLAGGELEFIGRTDNQVKLRGYRIELGEIETALREHESVSDCVVVMRDEKGQKSRLVAYVVSAAEMKKASAGDLRDHLRRKLPEYMIPAAFMALKELPLTRHGKVDRRALPAPESLEQAETFVAPQTETEKTLAALWIEMLGVPHVSRNDDFFEVGGHSLLATQMVWNIRETFGVDFTLRSFFEYSTVTEQSELIETLKDKASIMSPAIVPIGRDQFRTTTPSRQMISTLKVSERHES